MRFWSSSPSVSAVIQGVLNLADRVLVLSFFHVAEAEHVPALNELRLVLRRHDELRDGIVQEPHFPVCNTEIIMGVRVLLDGLLFDAALEFLKDFIEALLLGRGCARGWRRDAEFVPELRGKIEKVI